MSDPKLISPLLDNYIVGDPISEKTGVTCCPALERDSQKKCIVKIISTPTSQSQLDALLLSGAYTDAQSALAYFRTVADGIIDEAKVLQRLSQLEGFSPYISWQLVPMTDGVGFDVYTLSEYRKTLAKLLRGDNLTHLAAVNLGLDLCTALAVCRRIGYLYVNLKSDNIYLSDNNTWKIGDIGFVRLDSLKYASLPERYRSEYTAPEINDAFASLNTTLDIYALGLVLYRIYNGNQLPANFEEAKKEQLPPPDYADYEMAEIILKACDPDPANRWQDPIEMGQALVSYMQRNGVNDTPIIPEPISIEPDAPASLTSETAEGNSPELNAVSKSVGIVDASSEPDEDSVEPQNTEINADAEFEATSVFLTASNDETAPEQNEDQLDGIDVTDEVSDILSHADELISHPTPDMRDLPVEVADTIDDIPEENLETATQLDTSDNEIDNINSSANATEEPELIGNVPDDASPIEMVDGESATVEAGSNDNEAVANDMTDEAAPEPGQEPSDATNVDISDEEDPAIPVEIANAKTTDAENEIDDESLAEDDTETDKPGINKKHWLRNLLIGLGIVALAVLAFLFYAKYYLQTIDSLSVLKTPDGKVTISISSKIEESMLSVVCADAAGVTQTVPVKNGCAVFENLMPGGAYTAKVTITGFHGLTGKTETEFTVPSVMKILDFIALTGAEDGSVLLSFSTQNQDSEEWMIAYKNDDGDEIIENFSGHNYSINGLTLGKSYTFTLTPAEEIQYTGTTEITHTVTKVIMPEDLHIVSIVEGKMTASWSAPADTSVEKWIVSCHGDKGFEKILDTDNTTIVIEGVEATEEYTIEVSAIGMSVSASIVVPANPISVADFNIAENGTNLLVSWTCNPAPQSELTLLYSVDGTELKEVRSSDNNAELENFIPEASYVLLLKDVNGCELVGGRYTYKTATADKFSGYHVKDSDMRFYPCKTPNKSNWTKKDLSSSDFTTTFGQNEKMSFLVELKDTYNTSKDSITTMFVFRDNNGTVVDYSTSTQTWTQMWYKGLCELNVPSTPSEVGTYTVSIYMNGMLAGESKVTIK